MKSKKNLRFAGAPLNAVACSDGVGVSGKVTMACQGSASPRRLNPRLDVPLMCDL